MSKVSAADIRAGILRWLPEDGATIGNGRMRSLVSGVLGAELEWADYFAARDALVQQGVVATGRGRGGSVRRVLEADAALTLQTQEIPESDKAPKPKQETMTLAQARRAKTEIKTKKSEDGGKVIAYHHKEKRHNNPEVDVVTPETDTDQHKKTWAYDTHTAPPPPYQMGRRQGQRQT